MSSRRAFLSQLASTGASLPALGAFVEHLTSSTAAEPRLARPTPAQRAWQDLEIGMFVHFAPNTWQDREYDDRSTPLTAITPDIDTEQWADVATAMGARYIVFVAKHVGGFCMWQTETSDYSVRNTPWRGGRGDVMADLARSCRKRGLGLGVYLSPRDDHHGAGLSGKCETPEKQAVYNKTARQQLTELTTRYGRLVEIWFDGSSVIPVGDLLAAHAPGSMIFQGPHATIRWVGNELGFAPYPLWNAIDRGDALTGTATSLHGDTLGDTWIPVEVDVSMRRPNWFWSTTNESNLLSLDSLIEIYYRSVGRGAQLLLNMSPDRSGRIADRDASRAAEFGAAIARRFGTAVGRSSGIGSQVEIRLAEARAIDHVVIQEDLAFGERVRGYRIEGLTSEGWQRLGDGLSIGHKRIHPVGAHQVRALRLVVAASGARPHIRQFSAFAAGVDPPSTWNHSVDVWADDEVGKWKGEAFEVDITKRVDAPGEYRVRFVAEGGQAFRLGEIDLRVSGASRRELIRRVPGRSDIFIATIPRASQPAVLRGRITGASRGSVLVRSL